MAVERVTEEQILEELRELDPRKWAEVRDFIGYLRHRATLESAGAHTRELTAHELLHSGLVGLWEGREDIGDSLEFARRLRREADTESLRPTI